MPKSRGASGSGVMILACGGASNVGQIANAAAVELTREGFGKMFCLAGIGGHQKGFAATAQYASHLLVIDGCSLACARATLEHAGIPIATHVTLTDLGLEKSKDLHIKPSDLATAKTRVKEACLREIAAAHSSARGVASRA